MVSFLDALVLAGHAFSTIIGIYVAVIAYRLATKTLGGAMFWSLLALAALLNVAHGVMLVIKLGVLFGWFNLAGLAGLVKAGVALPLPSSMYQFGHVAFAIQAILFAMAAYLMVQFFAKAQTDAALDAGKSSSKAKRGAR